MRNIRGVIAGSTFWFIITCAVPAAASTTELNFYVDLDGDPAAGCTVDTADGPFDGAETRLTAMLDPASRTVIALSRATCVGSAQRSFVPDIALHAFPVPGLDIGFRTGDDGADLIETFLPLEEISSSSVARLAVTLSDAAGTDALITLNGVVGESPIYVPLVDAHPVPMRASWSMLLVAAFLLTWAHRRRSPAIPLEAGLLLASVLMLPEVLRATSGDAFRSWHEHERVAADLADDAAPSTDLLSLYAVVEGRALYLRVDATLDDISESGVSPACATCIENNCADELLRCTSPESVGGYIGSCAPIAACVHFGSEGEGPNPTGPSCANSNIADCYCGTGYPFSICANGGANGACKEVIENNAGCRDEVNPSLCVLGRFNDWEYAWAHLRTLVSCEVDLCSSECGVEQPQALCGNGVFNAYEECDPNGSGPDLLPTGTPAGTSCSAACTIIPPPVPPPCGNGTIDRGEECDPNGDGPDVVPAGTSPGLICSSGCRRIQPPSFCGNGMVENVGFSGLDEVCDGANLGGAPPQDASCSVTCDAYVPRPSSCGNGALENTGYSGLDELCDRAELGINPPPNSGCNATCDGYVQLPPMSSNPSCIHCVLESCSEYVVACVTEDNLGGPIGACSAVSACAHLGWEGVPPHPPGPSCASASSLDCYCGDAYPFARCFSGGANGVCKQVIDDNSGCQGQPDFSWCVAQRLQDDAYGLGDFSMLARCEVYNCSFECGVEGLEIPPSCGNGILNGNEQCDPNGAGPDVLPPDTAPGTTCNASCQLVPLPVCGNGSIDANEDCDPNILGPDVLPTGAHAGTTCSGMCRLVAPPSVCGNGLIENVGFTGLKELCDGSALGANPPQDAICNDTCTAYVPTASRCGNAATA